MESTIILLSILFLILVFIVCGKKGFRLLASLALTVIALVWVIMPLIVDGHDPEIVVFLAGLPILIFVVYLTEGFKPLSHLSIIAVAFNFLLVSVVAHVSVMLAGLTGITSSDMSFLGIAGINLQELLVSGIMLGTLGILTEMVVTQVATVFELNQASPNADRGSLFRQSYSVGVAHLGSIINTLFLVYAGVSFPLLIIYVGDNATLSSALNYEPLASEFIRALAGTIGLIIAMPIATWLAVRWLKRGTTRGTSSASSR